MVTGGRSLEKWTSSEENGSSEMGIARGAVRVIWNADDSPTLISGDQKIVVVSTVREMSIWTRIVNVEFDVRSGPDSERSTIDDCSGFAGTVLYSAEMQSELDKIYRSKAYLKNRHEVVLNRPGVFLVDNKTCNASTSPLSMRH